MNAKTNPVKSRINSFIEPAQYEYKILTADYIKMNDLKTMGNDGWIFCQVFTSNMQNQYMFYRKK